MAERIADRYEVVRSLGSGGMGEVFLVRDERDGSLRALKRLTLQTPEAAARMREEFAFLARVDHPNIVQVFDYGLLAKGGAYFTMEYLNGRAFDEAVRPGDVSGAMRASREILAGLEAIYAAGLVHCDLKPSNVVLVAPTPEGGGRPVARVLDFGFAGRLDQSGEGKVRGTPGFVAPEVLAGGPYTRESDAYALGATLYRVLSGQNPFPGRDAGAIFAAQRRGLPSALSLRNFGVPRSLEAIVLQLLDPMPQARADGMRALAGLVAAKASIGQTLWESGASVEIGRGVLVDRTEELARLIAHLRRPGLRVAMVSGAEGVGRTRLAREVAVEIELRGWNVLWFDAEHLPSGQVSASGERRGLLLILDGVDAWPPGAIDPLLLESAPLPLAILATTDPGGEQGAWQRAFLRLPKDPSWLALELFPFDERETGELIRARLGTDPPDGLAHALRGGVGGTPGAIHAGLDRLMHTGRLRRFGERWEFDPRGLAEALDPRELDSRDLSWGELTARARRILLVVASWPEPIAEERIAEVSGELFGDVQEEIRSFAWHGWVEVAPGGLVSMPALRAQSIICTPKDPETTVTRECLSQELRRRLEAGTEPDDKLRLRTLRLLGTQESVLGRHGTAIPILLEAVRAATTRDLSEAIGASHTIEAILPTSGPEAAHVLADLGRIWRRLEGTSEAVSLWRRAIDALPEDEARRRAELAEEAAEALFRLGRYEEAVNLISEVLEAGPMATDAKDSPRLLRGRLMSLRGNGHHFLGRVDLVGLDLEEALRLLPVDALKDRALAENRLAIHTYMAIDPERGREQLMKALGTAERSADPGAIGRVHANLSLVARMERRFDSADEHMTVALEKLSPLGDVELLGSLMAGRVSILSQSGHWADLEPLANEVETLARRTGNESLLLNVLATRASVAARIGRLSELRRIQRTERAWLHRTDRVDAMLHHRLFVAEHARLLGREVSAVRLFRKVFGDSKQTSDPMYRALCMEGLGKLQFERGNLDSAERLFRRVLRLDRVSPDFLDSARLGLARVALIRKDESLCREIQTSVRKDPPRALGSAAVRIEIEAVDDLLSGRADSAYSLFSESAGLLADLGLIPRAIETARQGGRGLIQSRRPSEGRTLLLRAHSLARSHGLHRWAGRIADDVLEAEPSVSVAAEALGSADGIRNVLAQVSEVLNSILDFPTLLQKSLSLVCEYVGAERGFILLTDGHSGDLRPVASFGVVDEGARESALEVSRTVVRRVVESGEAFRSDDAASDPRLGSTLSILDLAVRSLLCVPLRIKSDPLGTVYLESRTSPAVFAERELTLVEAFANLVAISIQNSRLHDELRRSRDRVIQENLSLRREVTGRYKKTNIIGQSSEIERVLGEIERVAVSRGSVLISGESGTGKELIAKTIHFASPRAERPFLSLNCAALPGDLIEAELFGIEDHVATGVRGRPGIFERADGGTLFLDEIGDMPLSLQAKLLRVLQEREFNRLGGSKVIRVDIRLIAATNQDLRHLIREGRFREDLFFRIYTLPIHIAPLRERKVDVPVLAKHFLERFCEENGIPVPRMSSGFVDVLLRSNWTGNVRELQNYIERSVVMSRQPILEPTVLPSDLESDPAFSGEVKAASTSSDSNSPASQLPSDLKRAIEDLERQWILLALDQWSGNQRQAARALGVMEPTLRYRIARLGIGPASKDRRVRSKTSSGRAPTK